MSKRRTRAALAALIGLAAAVLLAGCARAPGAETSQSPSTSPVLSETLPLGQSATVGGFEMTPRAVRTRPGPVYDAAGKRMRGHGIKIIVKVAKDREADLSGANGELTVPVARVVDAQGHAVRMDDFFGMLPYEAQSAEYAALYVSSYQAACIQQPGAVTAAALWFSLPHGFLPETLVIDAGAGREATWLLP